MGFDYEIQYKPGQENVVADALSRVQGSEVLMMAISVIDSNLTQAITDSYALDDNTMGILHKLQNGEDVLGFKYQEGLLIRHGRIVVGLDENLKKQLIGWQPASLKAEHSGRDHTTKRLQGLFYWRGMSKE